MLLTALLAALPSQRVYSAEPSIPLFSDVKQPMTKPDPSKIARMRFLTTTDFPPFNVLGADGQLSGFHVDLARAICAELGIADRCEIQALPWGELETALAKGDGEAIIAGLAVNSENRARYAFSRSYLRFPARFVALKTSTLTEPLAQTLKGQRVGVIAGSAHERLLRNEFNGVDAVPYDSAETLAADLTASKIDAAFGDGMRYSFWLNAADSADCCRFVGGPYMASEYLGAGLAIATMPAHRDYAAAFDAALQQLSAKGVFADLYLRYFPISFY